VLVFFLDETFEEITYDITTTVGAAGRRLHLGVEGAVLGLDLGSRPSSGKQQAAQASVWPPRRRRR
jgi:hypothetical protein